VDWVIQEAPWKKLHVYLSLQNIFGWRFMQKILAVMAAIPLMDNISISHEPAFTWRK
jgi:hypothetical protein